MRFLFLYGALTLVILTSSAPLNGDEGAGGRRAVSPGKGGGATGNKQPTTKAVLPTTKTQPPPTTKTPLPTTRTASTTAKSQSPVVSSPTSVRSTSKVVNSAAPSSSPIHGQSSSVASVSNLSVSLPASGSASRSTISSGSSVSAAIQSSVALSISASGAIPLSQSGSLVSSAPSMSASSTISAVLSASASESAVASACPRFDSLYNSTSSERRTFQAGGLEKRVLRHASGRANLALYHGTADPANLPRLQRNNVQLESRQGDLHHHLADGVDGGFYLTDSLLAAAQFACRNIAPVAFSNQRVYVVEYIWQGANQPVKDFGYNDPQLAQFINYNKESHTNPTFDQYMAANSMITAQMNFPGDEGLSPDFWQYAIIKQSAINNGALFYVRTHQLTCSGAVPIGSGVRDRVYTATTGPSSQMDQNFLWALTSCPGGSIDWHRAIS